MVVPQDDKIGFVQTYPDTVFLPSSGSRISQVIEYLVAEKMGCGGKGKKKRIPGSQVTAVIGIGFRVRPHPSLGENQPRFPKTPSQLQTMSATIIKDKKHNTPFSNIFDLTYSNETDNS